MNVKYLSGERTSRLNISAASSVPHHHDNLDEILELASVIAGTVLGISSVHPQLDNLVQITSAHMTDHGVLETAQGLEA